MKLKKTVALLGCLIVAACSHVEIKHVNDGDESEGIHFYEPKPYLMVTVLKDAGKAESYTSAIVWLPDTTKKYVVRPVTLLGTVDASVSLTDGWRLASFGAKTDSKIPETISALTGVAKLGMGVASTRTLQSGLYEIRFENNLPVLGEMVPGWGDTDEKATPSTAKTPSAARAMALSADEVIVCWKDRDPRPPKDMIFDDAVYSKECRTHPLPIIESDNAWHCRRPKDYDVIPKHPGPYMPEGWVITGEVVWAFPPNSDGSSKNAWTIQRAKTESLLVCKDSPVPADYKVSGDEDCPTCPPLPDVNGKHQPNAWRIERK